MTDHKQDVSDKFEEAGARQNLTVYLLRLYVAGTTPRSTQAIANIKKICNEHLAGRYELDVIDTYQKPHLAKKDQVVALPTLIKALPSPLRRIIGDLSDIERVLVGLDLIEKKQGGGK